MCYIEGRFQFLRLNDFYSVPKKVSNKHSKSSRLLITIDKYSLYLHYIKRKETSQY